MPRSLRAHIKLAQSPLGDEVHQRRLHFPPIEPDPYDVHIRIAGEPLDVLLPLFDSRYELSQLSPRKDSRVARFHVENLDPTCPEIRQVVGESDIDHDQENVMERIQQRQLRDYAFGIRKQEIGYDGNERRSS